MKINEERLQDLFAYLDRQTHVQPEEIPNIDLYMDQVTTFMEEHLKNTRRYEEDKVLTKTMSIITQKIIFSHHLLKRNIPKNTCSC